jgi:hypothetical protein
VSRSPHASGIERQVPLTGHSLSHRGVEWCGLAFDLKPSLNIAAAPTDPTTMELKLLWEPADQRQCSKNPSVASRQPSDIVRGEYLVPRR